MPSERAVAFPYPFDQVWNAASLVLKEAGWNVTKMDKTGGHFLVQIKMDLLAAPETFYIDVVRIDEKETGVRAGGIVPYQLGDLGIGGSYVDSFLAKLKQNLDGSSSR